MGRPAGRGDDKGTGSGSWTRGKRGTRGGVLDQRETGGQGAATPTCGKRLGSVGSGGPGSASRSVGNWGEESQGTASWTREKLGQGGGVPYLWEAGGPGPASGTGEARPPPSTADHRLCAPGRRTRQARLHRTAQPSRREDAHSAPRRGGRDANFPTPEAPASASADAREPQPQPRTPLLPPFSSGRTARGGGRPGSQSGQCG